MRARNVLTAKKSRLQQFCHWFKSLLNQPLIIKSSSVFGMHKTNSIFSAQLVPNFERFSCRWQLSDNDTFAKIETTTKLQQKICETKEGKNQLNAIPSGPGHIMLRKYTMQSIREILFVAVSTVLSHKYNKIGSTPVRKLCTLHSTGNVCVWCAKNHWKNTTKNLNQKRHVEKKNVDGEHWGRRRKK